MYTPHTVTIINTYTDEMLKNKNNLTVLEGVFYDASKGSNVRMSGLENADSVVVYVPVTVNAYDPITNNKKYYLNPKDFEEVEDKENYFTFDVGETCFFAKGIVTDERASFKQINDRYNAHRITKIDLKDFGSSSMQHWEVGGA